MTDLIATAVEPDEAFKFVPGVGDAEVGYALGDPVSAPWA